MTAAGECSVCGQRDGFHTWGCREIERGRERQLQRDTRRGVRLKAIRDELHAEVVARSEGVEYRPDSVYGWLVDRLASLTVDLEAVKDRLGL